MDIFKSQGGGRGGAMADPSAAGGDPSQPASGDSDSDSDKEWKCSGDSDSDSDVESSAQDVVVVDTAAGIRIAGVFVCAYVYTWAQ